MPKASCPWSGPGYNLSMASRYGNLNEVQKLLDEGADVNWTNECGCTALYYACFKGHVEVVQLLLDRGAQMDIQDDSDGTTSLMMAIQFGHVEVVKLLLDRGALIDIQNNWGGTALMFAICPFCGKTECVRLLLEKGADMSIKDKDGKTAKDRAMEKEEKGQDNGHYNDEQRMNMANTLHLLIEVCILQTHKCFNDRHS
jgi:ankyrin repeat protein